MGMQDKTVIITGGSRGMGQRLAVKLGAKKANVVVNYRRDDEAANATVAEIEALGGSALAVRADVADTESVESLVQQSVDRYGSLDVVVANAAASAFKPLSQIYGRHIEKTMGLTVQGFLDLVRLSTPHMNEGGRVMAVSGWDSFRVLPGHGLPGRRQSGDGDPREIPGHRAGAGQDHHHRRLSRSHRHRLLPLLRRGGVGRLREAVAEADAVRRLSDSRRGGGRDGLPRLSESAAINGQTIVVDGGLSLATMPIGFGQD